MGFLTRFLAGLVAASTLGVGLAGTADAVDTTGTDTTANGVVKLADDDTSNLPDHLVNGDFEYPSMKSLPYMFTAIDRTHKQWIVNGQGSDLAQWADIPGGLDTTKFGWTSTQTQGTVSEQRANAVELQKATDDTTQMGELCASQAGTAIYQDIATTPGTLYKVELDHASRYAKYLDKMQVMVGAPGSEQPVEMTRTTSNKYGDKVGEKSTTIATHSTNPFGHQTSTDDFSHYVGYYVIPEGQTVTRFTFKQISGATPASGNLLDNIVFTRAYKLSYDKNAQDASGKVPSDTTANTVKQAKSKTTGSVKLAADASSKSLTVNPGFDVPDYSKLDDGGLHWMYVNPAEGKAWSYYDYITPGNPKHSVDGLSQATFGWQELTGGDHTTTSFELHREKDGNVCADVHGSRTIGQTINTQAGVAYTVSIRHSGRSKGNAGSVQVLVGPDKDHLQPLEMSRMNVSRTGAKYGDRIGKVGTVITTHSDSVDSTEGDHPAWDHSDDWETYSGTYVATGDTTVFAYRGVNKDGNAVSGTSLAADSMIDDLSFKLAYKLSYDKNADDASGQVPSNETADTTQPAKTATTGSVRLASDRADGTVKDLVQRTTTHEDGSVTVKTVDQSTDVVQGCQVYYPAGQKITLATMAKDDDCWDSSMLTRPGHTLLGWSQDRNATAAQAEVTMVEGGMTVYAVWVGNPVLTYDTNKPSTWNGQMPSTPASVSVTYNTAAADGSGWKSGDVSKIQGYRFLGWYTGPQDNAGLYDWNTLLTGNVTVYAHWQRLQANVIYDKNASDATGSHAPTTGWQYSDVTVPSDTSKSFKREGYYFKYWNTQKDGKGTTYKDSAQVPLQDKDVTLYAIWAPYTTVITETGGIGLPVLVAGGITLLVMGIGSTVMLTRRMRGER